MPLVYSTRRAAREAAALLPGAILECEVERAILAGDCDTGSGGGYVFLDQYRAVAHVKRLPGLLRQRPRQWLITDLTPNKKEKDHAPLRRQQEQPLEVHR